MNILPNDLPIILFGFLALLLLTSITIRLIKWLYVFLTWDGIIILRCTDGDVNVTKQVIRTDDEFEEFLRTTKVKEEATK